jgi:hypothetical protein
MIRWVGDEVARQDSVRQPRFTAQLLADLARFGAPPSPRLRATRCGRSSSGGQGARPSPDKVTSWALFTGASREAVQDRATDSSLYPRWHRGHRRRVAGSARRPGRLLADGLGEVRSGSNSFATGVAATPSPVLSTERCRAAESVSRAGANAAGPFIPDSRSAARGGSELPVRSTGYGHGPLCATGRCAGVRRSP